MASGNNGQKPAFIESLSFQKIAKGTKLLGIVREVAPEYAVVSLPSMLTGFIRPESNSGVPLNRVVDLGMMLPVVVLKTASESVGGDANNKTTVVKRRLELSVSPTMLNNGLAADMLYEGMVIRGRIKSVEDHGCIVDLHVNGIGGASCFLKFENIEGEYEVIDEIDANYTESSKNVKLNKGRVYDFTILQLPSFSNASATSIIQLKLESAETRSKRLVPVTSKHTIRTLTPGMLVESHVEHNARNGICVTFLGHVYRGSIDLANLGGYFHDSMNEVKKLVGKNNVGLSPSDMWWKHVFTGKLRTINARLIAVDPVTKIVRLSLSSHILSLTMPQISELPPVGTVVENSKVIRLDPGIGALLALPTSYGNDYDVGDNMDISDESKLSHLKSSEIYRIASTVKCAYVHISKAFDTNGKEKTPDSLFAKKFSLNSCIPKLRILSTSNYMDNIASCATAESIISAAVLTHNDIQPGVVYKSVPIIGTLAGGSILVQLGGSGIKGLVPPIHLFDKGAVGKPGDKANAYRNKVRMEKFKVGNKIDVRCLISNTVEKKCILTAKNTLLQSDLENPITDYSKVSPGQIATGFISSVTKKGLTITFYNNVFGKVSAKNLAEELGIEDPTMDYSFGDVIKARVNRCLKIKRSTREGEDDIDHDAYYLELSLNLSAPPRKELPTLINEISNHKLTCGMILPPDSMKVIEMNPSKRHNEGDGITPGYAIISLKTKFLNTASDDVDEKTVKCRLPYDQLLDLYDTKQLESADALDELANVVLKVGKKIKEECLVISIPVQGKSKLMPILSLRKNLIASSKVQNDNEDDGNDSSTTNVLLPNPSTSLYMGAYVHGYCMRLDSRHGAFIRFLDNLTGLIPKLKGGLDVSLYETVLCKIVALDVTDVNNPKILLKKVKGVRNEMKKQSERKINESKNIVDLVAPGDIIGDVKVHALNFVRAKVTPLDPKLKGLKIKARIHMTLADSIDHRCLPMPLSKKNPELDEDDYSDAEKITKYHPFFRWSIGSTIKDVTCVSMDVREGVCYLELTNRKLSDTEPSPVFVKDPNLLKAGTNVTCVITSVPKQNKGLWVQICPGVTGFVPGLELSDDLSVLNDMSKYFKIGGKIICTVIDHKGDQEQFKNVVRLSARPSNPNLIKRTKKPTRGDIIVGRVNRIMKQLRPPSLMLELPDGYLGHCDVTEIDEVDEWSNMPLGRQSHDSNDKKSYSGTESESRVEDGDDDIVVDPEELLSRDQSLVGDYKHGLYVRCRVLSSRNSSTLEVSLRESRIEGDLDNDELPDVNEIVHAYVVTTNKKGCFLRLSRFVEGRVILKELSDSFLPDPVAMFPPGRLVVGKVKVVRTCNDEEKNKTNKNKNTKTVVDLDLRESILLQDENKLTFEDVQVNEKYRGIVTRIEAYGVFVRLENSEVSGLVHLSECSDDYVKNLSSLYDPGDLVKVMAIKVDKEEKRLSLSMKQSHFENDDDSDDESLGDSSSSDEEEDDVEMEDVLSDEDDIDSDDENFASRVASKMKKNESSCSYDSSDSSEDDDDDDSGSSDDSTSDDSSHETDNVMQLMDTNVGFDWGTSSSNTTKHKQKISPSKYSNGSASDTESSSSSDYESGSDDDAEDTNKSNKKSRKKLANKRKEEKEIAFLEQRIADGTAQANPETAADMERIIASQPNSSEHWIKYMAYYLSLADIDSARNIAKRAFDRIEFRQEGEKLNVWTALITLENKYGSSKTFQETVDQAAQHNNPKQVYLRVCEMLSRDVENHRNSNIVSESTIHRANEMFTKMCMKFKSKKKVWIEHFKYLLKNARSTEAHELQKRSFASLAPHKHVETMSKYAQLEYEYGSPERARTIFDSLLEKNRKRMDLLFVYIDKEVKHGDVDISRRIFQRILNPPEGQVKMKYNDKQMKSLFKKWYRMEEEYGNDESRLKVKLAAKAYVESMSTSNDQS
jgi:rRNA biogenesis protein RRP5